MNPIHIPCSHPPSSTSVSNPPAKVPIYRLAPRFIGDVTRPLSTFLDRVSKSFGTTKSFANCATDVSQEFGMLLLPSGVPVSAEDLEARIESTFFEKKRRWEGEYFFVRPEGKDYILIFRFSLCGPFKGGASMMDTRFRPKVDRMVVISSDYVLL